MNNIFILVWQVYASDKKVKYEFVEDGQTHQILSWIFQILNKITR